MLKNSEHKKIEAMAIKKVVEPLSEDLLTRNKISKGFN
jgi:hypothetical protein